MSNGLRELMSRGVVVSGDEAPVIEMGSVEGMMAFATWLDFAKADGSVPFSALAQVYADSQGWEIKDADFRRKLRAAPTVSARALSVANYVTDQASVLPEPPSERESADAYEGTVPVTAPVAVVIDPNNPPAQTAARPAEEWSDPTLTAEDLASQAYWHPDEDDGS